MSFVSFCKSSLRFLFLVSFFVLGSSASFGAESTKDSLYKPIGHKSFGKKEQLRIVLIGAPSVGKGVQAKVISSEYGIPTFSAGKIIRKISESNSLVGRQVTELMEKGDLVPDEIVNKLIAERISEKDCERGFISDGYPRTIDQAKALYEMTKKKDGNTVILVLEASEEALLSRLRGRIKCAQCNNTKDRDDEFCRTYPYCSGTEVIRADDKEEILLHRVRTYNKETTPVISYYEKVGYDVVTIDSNLGIREVSKKVVSELERVRAKNKAKNKKFLG